MHGRSVVRRIAIIGFPADYFLPFGAALEEEGFEVFWVHASHSAAQEHRKILGGDTPRIIDSTAGFSPGRISLAEAESELRTLECGGLRIHDLILMDRILRHKSYDFALKYLCHVKRVMMRFFSENHIGLVNSGRDTALCLIGMLVCRKLGIQWVVPTRIRIPREWYMFTEGHETDSMVDVRAVTNDDRAWARQFHSEYLVEAPRPVLKAAAAEFSDVLRMLPQHMELFRSALSRSFFDRGNDYSRYTIGKLMAMYAQRRMNMLRFKASQPHDYPGSRPFGIYALHTQPESSIDVAGSYFSNQVALVTFIARSLPVTHELYVKIHPTDVDGKPLSFYEELSRIPGVRLINYDVDSKVLVERASIVFVLTGTIGYESGLRGKPVIAFARNYYNEMPTVHYCDAPPQLPSLIDRIIDKPPPVDWRERVVEFMAKLRARSFQGDFNRMWQQDSQPLSADDLRQLRLAYATLYDTLDNPK